MIKREIIKNIKKWVGKNKIIILNGSRQVGKTTILQEIEKELIQKKKKVVYLLADDFDNQPIFSSLSNLELYLKQFHKFPKNFIYLMIDEFQVLNNAGLFLKNIYDKYKGKLQIIVSGSSSLAINKSSEFLTGRTINFNVERINFKEYFDYINGIETKRINLLNFSKIENFYNTFKLKLEQSFREYIIFGGYPEVITTNNVEDKKIILKSIIKTYIEKDIINQLNVENVSGFNNLIKILSSQIGNLVNNNEISNTIGLSINTLKKYLDILKGTYIFDFISPYYKNIRSEISKMPKNYILDLGIKNYIMRSYDLNIEMISGEVIENFVYLSLLSQFVQENIHFYRTISGSEIDFVIEQDDNKKILCEVKYRNRVKEPLAMRNFEKKYQVNKKIIITKNLIKKENNVYYLPALIFPFIKL